MRPPTVLRATTQRDADAQPSHGTTRHLLRRREPSLQCPSARSSSAGATTRAPPARAVARHDRNRDAGPTPRRSPGPPPRVLAAVPVGVPPEPKHYVSTFCTTTHSHGKRRGGRREAAPGHHAEVEGAGNTSHRDKDGLVSWYVVPFDRATPEDGVVSYCRAESVFDLEDNRYLEVVLNVPLELRTWYF